MKSISRKNNILFILTCTFAILGILATANLAHAISLGDLFAGSDLTVGDKHFFNWELKSSDNIGSLGDIEVLGINNPLNPGLNYTIANNALSASAGQNATLFWTYDVEVTDPLFFITDNSLELQGFEVNDLGSILISELVWDNPNETGNHLIKNVSKTPFGEKLFDEIDFNGLSFLHIEKQISVSGLFPTGSASLFQFEQRFSQSPIPEPTTITLLGFGLIGLAGFRRKLKKR